MLNAPPCLATAAPTVAAVLAINPPVLLVLAGLVADVVVAANDGVVKSAVGILCPIANRARVTLARAGERLCIGHN